MTPTVHRLDAAGVVLRVHERGEGAAVVLLHGFTGDASTMEVLAEPLAQDRRVLVPDLVGHGGSRAEDPARYGVDAMAEQLVAILDRLDEPAPVDVVGYSMGGRVALTLACTAPERVRTLTLIGATAGLATEEARTERIAADEALAQSIEQDGLAAFVDRWMANPLFASQARLGEEALAGFRNQRLGNDGSELARSLRAAGTGSMRPLHDAVGECPVPTTLVVGAEDEKFTAIAHELAGLLPTARVTSIPAAGHAAHLEQPEAVVAAIRDRLERPVVSVLPSLLQLNSPLSTARGDTTLRETLLVRVAGFGEVGWGEASPLPGWSLETIDGCLELLDDPGLRHRIRALATTAGGGLDWWPEAVDVLAELDAIPSVRAAVVGALLDLEARGRGLVLADLLVARFGDASKPAMAEVPIHGLLSAGDATGLADETRRLVAGGVETFKVKVAALALERDVERLAAVRAAAPDARLRIDANGGWAAGEAVAALDALERFDVELCEEPVRGIEAIAAVGADSPIPVAVDESARSLDDLARVWDHADHIDAVVLKPQALGGADLALAAIASAERHGIDVVVTTMIDSAVGVAHAAHVAAAARLPGPHGLDTARLLAEDVAEPLPVAAGRLWLRQHGAGIGVGIVSPVDHGGS